MGKFRELAEKLVEEAMKELPKPKDPKETKTS